MSDTTELEVRMAFLEQMLEEMSRELVTQQQHVAKLERTQQVLINWLRSLPSDTATANGVEVSRADFIAQLEADRPPHY